MEDGGWRVGGWSDAGRAELAGSRPATAKAVLSCHQDRQE